jgi:hypothetical protein
MMANSAGGVLGINFKQGLDKNERSYYITTHEKGRRNKNDHSGCGA